MIGKLFHFIQIKKLILKELENIRKTLKKEMEQILLKI
jgi:hypothetical protein